MAYRILSLDGGGTWALIQVKALISIYNEATPGHKVLADFDLIAANSGGSIVAASLACNFTLGEILAHFLDPAWRDQIFVPLPPFETVWSKFFPVPKYIASAKLEGFQRVFQNGGANYGTMTLDQLPPFASGKTQLIITSFDFDRQRAIFFRSNLNSPARSGAQPLVATLAQAVHASSNAPIKYFDKPAAFLGHRFWDGAMAALNNPTMVAVAEALALRGPGIKPQIKVRSIGTGSVFLPIKGEPVSLLQAPIKQGLLADIGSAATCVLDDPPDQTTFFAYTLLDGTFPAVFPYASDAVVRMNPLVQPLRDENGRWQVPRLADNDPPLSEDEFQVLVDLGLDPNQDETKLIEKFCDAWINNIYPNQPIRANSDTLACEIGHATFDKAKAMW